MTLIVPHHRTQQDAVAVVDRGANELFSGIGGGAVEIKEFKKSWTGSTMAFSFTGSMGFISIPLSGTVAVDDSNITIQCELPAMVKNFIGDEKVAGAIERKLTPLLAP